MTKLRYAFKCRNCGHLEDGANAGEREVPAACRNCGAGVSFDPKTGSKVYDPENWIVLADLEGDELQEVLDRHGIEKSQVARHKPEPPADADREPTSIDRSVTDGVGQEDVAG